MSDGRLRELERNYRATGADEDLTTWVMARRRSGEKGIEAFRVLRFDRSQYACHLLVTAIERNALSCKTCDSEGKRDRGGRSVGCYDCRGTGIVRDYIEEIQIAEVNKILDHIGNRVIVGRWRRTKTGLLRWVGQ